MSDKNVSFTGNITMPEDKKTINRLCDELSWAATKLDSHTGDTFFGDRLRKTVQEVKGETHI